MNVLVIIVPVLAAGVFVALWASRSKGARRKDRNGDGGIYGSDGDGGSWDGGGDSGGGGDGGGGGGD